MLKHSPRPILTRKVDIINKEKEGKDKNSYDVNFTINSLEKMTINFDTNYFNFKESLFKKDNDQLIIKKKNSNDSVNYSYEKIDDEKEFPEKRFFVLLEEEGQKENIFTQEEWKEILRKGVSTSICGSEREKMISSLMLGIPYNQRGSIWKFLSKSENVSLNHPKDFYHKLLDLKNEDLDLQIKKDIERTTLLIGNNFNFGINEDRLTKSQLKLLNENKRKLFNILKAYAVYDPQVGYCQGTNFIVMMILSNVKSSREAFWIFVQIMHDKNWRNMFVNNTPKLLNLLDKLANEIKIKIPDLYCHMEQENFIEQIPGAFTSYFTTIFSYNVPIEYSNRVFDLFWIFEDKIIIDCLIHLMKMEKNNLLQMDSDELHLFLKKDLVPTCIKESSIEKSLPMHNRLLEEKEIIIEL